MIEQESEEEEEKLWLWSVECGVWSVKRLVATGAACLAREDFFFGSG